MKPGPWSLLALCAVASSQLVVLTPHRGARGFAGPKIPSDSGLDRDQRPIAGDRDQQLPSMEPSTGAPGPGGHGSVMLSDVMGRDRSINMFASFTRDIESVTRRLEDPSGKSIVLAPLNSAVESLPRKPWEDPLDYGTLGANAYEGEEGYERAQRNLRRFVEAHIIPLNPWPEGQKVKSLGHDREIWWEDRDGAKVIQPDEIEVVGVAGSVANGQLWILNGVRNY